MLRLGRVRHLSWRWSQHRCHLCWKNAFATNYLMLEIIDNHWFFIIHPQHYMNHDYYFPILATNSWLEKFWLPQKKFISIEPKNCRVGFATTEFLSTSSKSLQQERRSRCQTSMTWWHFAVRSSPSQIFFFPFFCKSSHRILVQPRKMCLLMAVDMTACNNVQKFLVKR